MLFGDLLGGSEINVLEHGRRGGDIFCLTYLTKRGVEFFHQSSFLKAIILSCALSSAKLLWGLRPRPP